MIYIDNDPRFDKGRASYRLAASSQDELMDFAKQIGIQTDGYRPTGQGKLVVFKVSGLLQRRAIARGARLVSNHALNQHINKHRAQA